MINAGKAKDDRILILMESRAFKVIIRHGDTINVRSGKS